MIRQVYIQGVTERLATLQLALELLAAMCSQDDSEGKRYRVTKKRKPTWSHSHTNRGWMGRCR